MAYKVKPRRGQYLREAWWFDADQPDAWKHARTMVMKRFLQIALDYAVVLGQIEWLEVTPDSPLVPEPPEKFQGNIKAMIGTVKVVEEACQVEEGRLTEELVPEQLAQMRAVTRRNYYEATGVRLTDEECEYWINSEGPESAISGSGTIH